MKGSIFDNFLGCLSPFDLKSVGTVGHINVVTIATVETQMNFEFFYIKIGLGDHGGKRHEFDADEQSISIYLLFIAR